MMELDLSKYSNFSALAVDIFKYLSDQPIVLSLIGILILYFGYYSTIYKPIRTEKLHLYLSGFQFLSTYFILQMFIIYFFSNILTTINIVKWSSIIFLFILLFYIFSHIRYKIILKILVTIAIIYFIPKILWDYISRIENINLIAFFLILYHITMVIISYAKKDFINQNSYDYKEFYSKIKGMNILSYSIFIYPFRMAQNFSFYEDKEIKKEEKNKEQINKEFIIKSDILKSVIPAKQLKFIEMKIQESFFMNETWINSLLILISFYILFTDAKISVIMGIILFVYLFFALTCIASEYSIYTNGFLLVKIFPKVGLPFKCRLIEMDGKQIKVLLKGKSGNIEYNPIEYHPLTEISKIRYISMGEMIDEF